MSIGKYKMSCQVIDVNVQNGMVGRLNVNRMGK